MDIKLTSVIIFPIIVFHFQLAKSQTQLGTDIIITGPVLTNVGEGVSISENGNRIAVGQSALNNGAYIYEYLGGAWIQLGATISGSAYGGSIGDDFGMAVSLSSSGDRVAIGARSYDGVAGTNCGRVLIYEYNGINWAIVGSPINGQFFSELSGRSVSLSSDGKRVAIGAPFNGDAGQLAGEVRIFEEAGGIWNQMGSDIAPIDSGGQFGHDIAISGNGNRVVIGAPTTSAIGFNYGLCQIYEWNGSVWNKVGNDIAVNNSSLLGYSVDISDDGSTVIVGGPSNSGGGIARGLAQIYELVGNTWTQLGTDIIGIDYDKVGFTVAISGLGTGIAVGSLRDQVVNLPGKLDVYAYNGINWISSYPSLTGTAANDRFSYGIELSKTGESMIVGAPGVAPGYVRVFGNPVLALKYQYIDATVHQSKIKLVWETSNGLHGTEYRIFHSTNSENWVMVDTVNSLNNSTIYSYLHDYPENGHNYYLIQYADLDGNLYNSPITSVVFNSSIHQKMFFDQSSHLLKIEYPEIHSIRICNRIGQEIFVYKNVAKKLDLSHLEEGLYYVQAVTNSGTFFQIPILILGK